MVLLGRMLDFWEVETDKNSADFMKIRIGNAHIDPWGGAQQFVVFFARLTGLMTAPITGKQARGKSSVTGAEYPIEAGNLIENFLKSKEAPLIGLLNEYLTGKTYTGEKINAKNLKQWIDRFAPMSVGDIYEAIADKTESTLMKVSSSVLSFTGFGVQNYTGDWKENLPKLGLPKYSDNVWYGLTEPVYSWADAYTDTASQFKGVDPATLTKEKGFDPKVKAIVETARSIEQSSIIPNMKLTSINADATKGKTFADYYRTWQDRQKIVASGDEKALKAFDADDRNNQAYIGNFSQRDFTLLTQYWSITDKKKQVDFLKQHPELSQNPREEWLKSHPLDNALQALAGKAKILTQEAYDKAQALIKELDIPDSAVSMYLPPKDVAKAYFERNDLTPNSWEDKLLRANNPKLVKWLNESGQSLEPIDTPIASLELKVKNRANYDKLDSFSDKDSPDYIADEKARAGVVAKFKTANTGFVDDTRRIEAIEKGTDKAPVDQKLVDAHVGYGQLTDKEGVGSSSAEVMLYRVDNPDYDKWRQDVNVWGDSALKLIDQSRIPIWRIDVKYKKQDAEYEAIKNPLPAEQARLRDEYLGKNETYRKDRRRREAYQKGLGGQVENYVAYYELPVNGYRQERFLFNNPNFASALGLKVPDRVPAEQYDILLEKPEKTPDDLLRMDAYKLYVPDNQIESYVSYYRLTKPSNYEVLNKTTLWFEDDWFMFEHPQFYRDVYIGLLGNQRKDFTKLPTRKVFDKYLEYVQLLTDSQKRQYRWDNEDLDAWGSIRFGWTPINRQPNPETPGQRAQREFGEGMAKLRAGQGR